MHPKGVASRGPVFRRRSDKTEPDRERLAQAMQYLKSGATYREAAAKFGFSKTYLWHRSRKFGITSRKPGVNLQYFVSYLYPLKSIAFSSLCLISSNLSLEREIDKLLQLSFSICLDFECCK